LTLCENEGYAAGLLVERDHDVVFDLVSGPWLAIGYEAGCYAWSFAAGPGSGSDPAEEGGILVLE